MISRYVSAVLACVIGADPGFDTALFTTKSLVVMNALKKLTFHNFQKASLV